MNTQWELYFLRREIERQKIQKQRKKKRRIWIAGISGLLALVFLAGGISMVRFYRSDYGKLKRAADQYDFRLAAVIRLSLGSIQSPILSGVSGRIRGGSGQGDLYAVFVERESCVSGYFSVGGDFRRSDAGSC